MHAPLLRALEPAVLAGRVRVVFRHQFNRLDEGGRWLTRAALASAFLSDSEYRRFVAFAIGTPTGLSVNAIRGRLADVIDVESYDDFLATNGPVFDDVIRFDDAAIAHWLELAELESRYRTPLVVMSADQGQTVLETWQGDIDPMTIASAIEAAPVSEPNPFTDAPAE